MGDEEFPDPDEEFDLVPTQIYQKANNVAVIKEVGTSSQQNKFSQSSEIVLPRDINNKQIISNGKVLKANENDFPDIDEELELNDVTEKSVTGTIEQTRKRTFDELFGDIKDLLQEDFSDDIPFMYGERKDKKPRWDQPELVIEAIKNQRKISKDNYEPSEVTNTSSVTSTESNKTSKSITLRVPPWNFVAVTRNTDAQRLYIKVRPEHKFDTTIKIRPLSGLLSVNYSQLKEQADKINKDNAKRAANPPVSRKKISNDLWVDKYRPKTYMELLSDETVNKNFLH